MLVLYLNFDFTIISTQLARHNDHLPCHYHNMVTIAISSPRFKFISHLTFSFHYPNSFILALNFLDLMFLCLVFISTVSWRNLKWGFHSMHLLKC